MLLFPNAKINLGLYITEKRKDGFHNLETIFLPIGLSDVLEFVESDVFEFTSTGLSIDCSADDNIVVKAYELLKKDFNLPNISIHLHKIIPFGAGLGGGSSDASFMIKGLNDHFDLNLSLEDQKRYAGVIGSDCPFFIDNKPSIAFGRGDELTPINVDLNGYSIAIVNPEIHVSTAEAYSNVLIETPSIELKDLVNEPIELWRDSIKNNFEFNICKNHPRIEDVKKQLYDNGAIYASMSGSGSTVFGIFRDKPNLKTLFPNYFVWEE